MALLGKIAVALVARTKPFQKGLNRARKMASRFARFIKGISKRMIQFGKSMAVAVAAAIAAAVAGMVFFVKRSFETIDVLAKTADKLGITTEKLAGLQHAAELSGVEVRTFNMALQRMTRRLSEAAIGTGEAMGAQKELGLDTKILGKLSPDKQFIAIADAMGKVTSQADKVRLSFKLFDSEGVALVNTLALGKKGLQDAMKFALKAGVALNRIDAAKIEMANDAVSRLGLVFRGIANTLAIKFAPFLKAAADKLVVWATTGKGAIGKVSDAFEWMLKKMAKAFDWVPFAKGVFAVFLSKVTQGLGFVALGFGKIIEAIGGASLAVGKLAQRAIRPLLTRWVQFANASAKDLEQFIHGIGILIRGFGSLIRVIGKVASAIIHMMRVGLAPMFTTVQIGMKALAGTARALGFDKMADRMTKAQRAMASTFNTLPKDVGAAFDKVAATVDNAGKKLEELDSIERWVTRTTRFMEAGFEVLPDAIKSAYDSIVSVAERGGKFWAETSKFWADKALAAFTDFESGKRSKIIAAWFEDIRRRADKAARDIANNLKGATPGLPEPGKAFKPGQFKQVVLERIALSGPPGMRGGKREQEIRSAQLETTNDHLRDIARNTQSITARAA